MVFTNEQLEAIKAAALPIDYGSITIQIGAVAHYLDIDVHHKLRIDKEPTEKDRKELLKNA
jgi:hypothetical protein